MAISFAYAIDFTFDSPDSINEDEEFTVTINAQTSDTYDVKIFVTDEIGKYGIVNSVSKIYNGEQWKNSFYFLNNVFPQQASFQNRVVNFSGETEICVSLRLSVMPHPQPDRICQPIIVNGNSENPNPNNSNNNQPDEDESGSDQEDSANASSQTTSPQIEPLAVNSPANKNPKKIVLNAPSKNDKADERGEITKEQKVRTWVIYGFIFLCVVLIVLLALKKL